MHTCNYFQQNMTSDKTWINSIMWKIPQLKNSLVSRFVWIIFWSEWILVKFWIEHEPSVAIDDDNDDNIMMILLHLCCKQIISQALLVSVLIITTTISCWWSWWWGSTGIHSRIKRFPISVLLFLQRRFFTEKTIGY